MRPKKKSEAKRLTEGQTADKSLLFFES